MVVSTTTPAQRPSLRDKHKDRTRQALREAALKLFAVRGYDATTIDEIAETAGVATRTFFRYFPTKEHALYHGEQDWIQHFVDVYPTQPKTLDDLEAMRVTLVGLTPQLAKARQALLLYQRAVDSSPTLRGREQVHHDETSAVLAQAIASRRGRHQADEACLLLACVGLLAYRRAVELWLAGPAKGSLGRAITKEFKLLRAQFSH
jgi:AcrR family transcriptional regulator